MAENEPKETTAQTEQTDEEYERTHPIEGLTEDAKKLIEADKAKKSIEKQEPKPLVFQPGTVTKLEQTSLQTSKEAEEKQARIQGGIALAKAEAAGETMPLPQAQIPPQAQDTQLSAAEQKRAATRARLTQGFKTLAQLTPEQQRQVIEKTEMTPEEKAAREKENAKSQEEFNKLHPVEHPGMSDQEWNKLMAEGFKPAEARAKLQETEARTEQIKSSSKVAEAQAENIKAQAAMQSLEVAKAKAEFDRAKEGAEKVKAQENLVIETKKLEYLQQPISALTHPVEKLKGKVLGYNTPAELIARRQVEAEAYPQKAGQPTTTLTKGPVISQGTWDRANAVLSSMPQAKYFRDPKTGEIKRVANANLEELIKPTVTAPVVSNPGQSPPGVPTEYGGAAGSSTLQQPIGAAGAVVPGPLSYNPTQPNTSLPLGIGQAPITSSDQLLMAGGTGPGSFASRASSSVGSSSALLEIGGTTPYSRNVQPVPTPTEAETRVMNVLEQKPPEVTQPSNLPLPPLTKVGGKVLPGVSEQPPPYQLPEQKIELPATPQPPEPALEPTKEAEALKEVKEASEQIKEVAEDMKKAEERRELKETVKEATEQAVKEATAEVKAEVKEAAESKPPEEISIKEYSPRSMMHKRASAASMPTPATQKPKRVLHLGHGGAHRRRGRASEKVERERGRRALQKEIAGKRLSEQEEKSKQKFEAMKEQG